MKKKLIIKSFKMAYISSDKSLRKLFIKHFENENYTVSDLITRKNDCDRLKFNTQGILRGKNRTDTLITDSTTDDVVTIYCCNLQIQVIDDILNDRKYNN